MASYVYESNNLNWTVVRCYSKITKNWAFWLACSISEKWGAYVLWLVERNESIMYNVFDQHHAKFWKKLLHVQTRGYVLLYIELNMHRSIIVHQANQTAGYGPET